MARQKNINNYKDLYAYDVAQNVYQDGELWDTKAINQSIEMILTTLYGERLFNPGFGSNFPLKIFDNMSQGKGEEILDDVVGAIKRWDDRIAIDESEVRLIVKEEQNTVVLVVPYTVRKNGIKTEYIKKFTN